MMLWTTFAAAAFLVQPATRFEVASVKHSTGCDNGGGRSGGGGETVSPDRLDLRCRTAADLVQTAYGRDLAISGLRGCTPSAMTSTPRRKHCIIISSFIYRYGDPGSVTICPALRSPLRSRLEKRTFEQLKILNRACLPRSACESRTARLKRDRTSRAQLNWRGATHPSSEILPASTLDFRFEKFGMGKSE
jgi:hypothetical protein